MKKKIVIIIFIVGVVLIGCGVGVYFLGGKPKEKETTNTENKEQEPREYMNVKSPDTDYYKTNPDGSMENISEKVKGTHTSGDFAFNNMTISIKSAEEPLASYSYTLTNNSGNNYTSADVSIVFIYSDGSKLNSSPSKVENIPAGGTVNVERKDYISIIGAVDYEIQVTNVQ